MTARVLAAVAPGAVDGITIDTDIDTIDFDSKSPSWLARALASGLGEAAIRNHKAGKLRKAMSTAYARQLLGPDLGPHDTTCELLVAGGATIDRPTLERCIAACGDVATDAKAAAEVLGKLRRLVTNCPAWMMFQHHTEFIQTLPVAAVDVLLEELERSYFTLEDIVPRDTLVAFERARASAVCAEKGGPGRGRECPGPGSAPGEYK